MVLTPHSDLDAPQLMAPDWRESQETRLLGRMDIRGARFHTSEHQRADVHGYSKLFTPIQIRLLIKAMGPRTIADISANGSSNAACQEHGGRNESVLRHADRVFGTRLPISEFAEHLYSYFSHCSHVSTWTFLSSSSSPSSRTRYVESMLECCPTHE